MLALFVVANPISISLTHAMTFAAERAGPAGLGRGRSSIDRILRDTRVGLIELAERGIHTASRSAWNKALFEYSRISIPQEIPTKYPSRKR
jgi:hypothetical protein